MCGKGLQCAFRHGVHGERRRERLDVKNVGSLGILGSRAGPQQALRTGAEVVDAFPARRGEKLARRLVGSFSDRDAELVAERLGSLTCNGYVPAADKNRRTGPTIRVKTTGEAPPISPKK